MLDINGMDISLGGPLDKVAQDERQNATVFIIFNLVERIYAAKQRDCVYFAIPPLNR